MMITGTKEIQATKLDWRTRQRICVSIAKGLVFLHEESTLKIVHRDIKGTNILLDKDMNTKISDFGMAKLDDEVSDINTGFIEHMKNPEKKTVRKTHKYCHLSKIAFSLKEYDAVTGLKCRWKGLASKYVVGRHLGFKSHTAGFSWIRVSLSMAVFL
jgi:serine/threonine protein kinase